MKYDVQQLSDRLEIEDLIAEYADAIDMQAFDRLDHVFTPDAHIDYSARVARGRGGSRIQTTPAASFSPTILPHCCRRETALNL